MNYKLLGCFAGILGASIAANSFLLQPLHAEPSRKPTLPTRSIKPLKPFVAKPLVSKPIDKVAQPAATVAAPSPGLEVKFDGVRDAQGQVCLSLFSGPTDFPKATSPDFVVKRCAPASTKGTSIMLGDLNLKPGNYAITAFHDANSDSKLNKGAFGIPEEGFGFSNNPEIGFSAPSFDDTKFKVSNTPSVVQIKFRYMK
jgi:uncharacterized protein (DUF2141 family)